MYVNCNSNLEVFFTWQSYSMSESIESFLSVEVIYKNGVYPNSWLNFRRIVHTYFENYSIYIKVSNLQYVIQFNFLEFIPLCYGTFSSKYLKIPSNITIFIQKVATSFSHDWPSSGYIILLSRNLHIHSYYSDITVKYFGVSSAKWGNGISFPNVSQMKCLR